MDTLYITDLDGTILTMEEELSDKSTDIINDLIAKGAAITLASARSPVSMGRFLQKLNLKLPVLCYNGEIIYDPVSETILRNFKFDNATCNAILDPLFQRGYSPFIHTVDEDGVTNVYHYEITHPGEKWYYNARQSDLLDNRFKQVHSSDSWQGKDIFHICLIGSYDMMSQLEHEFDHLDTITTMLYQDVYVEDTWWFEFYNVHGNKGDGLKWLKEKYNPKKVICFGDNYNDLPMFNVADKSVAPITAKDDIKNQADIIIGSPLDDSVPKYIRKDFG